MRKTALLLTAIMLVSLFVLPAGVYGASILDPYTGFATTSFDKVVSGSSYTANNGKLAVMAKCTFEYKDIDFGASSPKKVTLEIANDPGYADQVTELYADKVSGTPIATFTIKKGTGWANITKFSCDIKADISGVHTLYMVTTARPVDYYNITFQMALSGDAVYSEYSDSYGVFSDIGNSTYKKEINMLYSLGFTDKKEGEKFYPDHPVKRGDFAKVVRNIYGTAASHEAKEIFPDVPNTSEYFESVSFAFHMGYISGYPDGTFRPEKFIQISEAVKILCHILGYEHHAAAKGGFERGYLEIARRYDLLDGIAGAGILTNEVMAQLIYNAICADYYDANGFIGEDVYYEKNSDGILSSTRSIYREEGVVSANNITSLSVSETNYDKNLVLINGNDYIVGDSNARTLLGYECEVFYKEEAGKRTIVAAAPLDSVDVTKLDTSDEYISHLGTDKIVYYDKNDKEQEIELENAFIIYNGFSIDKKLSELLSKEGFRGSIKYIENPNGTNVLFVDEYKNLEIESVNKSEMAIFDKLSQKMLKYSGSYDKVYFEKNGEPIPITDVASGDIAMVYEGSNKSGRKFARFVLSDAIVSGTVSQVDSDDVIIIEGKEYKVAREFPEAVTVGKEATFKLNALGEIVSVSDEILSQRRVAWLIEKGQNSSSAFSKEILVKVLDQDNEIKEYSMADRGYVDGKKYENSNVSIRTEMCSNPIAYVLDSDGKIKQLDTVLPDEGGEKDSLCYVAGNSSTYFDWDSTARTLTTTGKGTPVNDYVLSEDAFVLNQPRGSIDAEDYSWTSGSISRVEWAELYSFDKEEGFIDILVKKNTAGEKTNSFVVCDVRSAIDSEGDTRVKLTLATSSGEQHYFVSDRNAEDMDIVCSLKCGDCIRGAILGEDIRNIEIIRLTDGRETLEYGSGKKATALIHNTKDNYGKITSGSTAERYAYAKVIGRKGKYVRVERIATGYREYVYVGNIRGMEYAETGDGKKQVKSGISADVIEKEDIVLFTFVNTSSKAFYIVGNTETNSN